MNRLVYFLFSLPLLLSFITSAHAGPACARRNQGADSCIEACKQKWGWPGFAMGTDRWGSVMTLTKTNDMGAVITQACRARTSGALGSVSISSNTSIPLSTQRAISTGAPSVAPANVIQTASASTITSAPVSGAHSVSLAPFAANSSSISIALLNTTKTSTKKASSTTSQKPTAFVTSTRPRTTSTPAPPKTSTPETTSTPPPAPPTTSEKPTTTPKTTQAKTTTTKEAAPTQKASSGNSSSNSGATSQSDIDAYLQAHNSVRAQHGASPLSWSDDLAASAQSWANNCVFQHSGGKLGPFGENLAAGTGNSYGIGPAVKSWTDEVSDYDPSNPEASHFTQVVWKGSTQVGCAVQSCSGIFDASFGAAKYFVCEYFPQGNIIGAFDKNVQA
ncbi:PR-1-like protein [Lentinus brumalis]|uniref:PR-1-like protein n=1 Tax=Lentinus brumalis TaxID=2498619 RepID=A0A371DTT4_9APHY|nr:PR-1-like protein [Polyporus brumalis]